LFSEIIAYKIGEFTNSSTPFFHASTICRVVKSSLPIDESSRSTFLTSSFSGFTVLPFFKSLKESFVADDLTGGALG